MPWNEKSLRLRGLRDKLHIRGRNECTFLEKVAIIVEVLGLVHSPRNLSWCRRETAKLREATPNPTPDQLARLGVLDDRLFKKAELIKARREKKAAKARGKRGPKPPTPTPPASTDALDVWAI